ncbi:MAG: hypothetical protein ABEJ23_03245 [Haloarculaceae archaeon]
MVSIRRIGPAIALLAILPVVAFVLDRQAAVVVLSALNVVIIASSLYLMFSPSDAAETAAAP